MNERRDAFTEKRFKHSRRGTFVPQMLSFTFIWTKMRNISRISLLLLLLLFFSYFFFHIVNFVLSTFLNSKALNDDDDKKIKPPTTLTSTEIPVLFIYLNSVCFFLFSLFSTRPDQNETKQIKKQQAYNTGQTEISVKINSWTVWNGNKTEMRKSEENNVFKFKVNIIHIHQRWKIWSLTNDKKKEDERRLTNEWRSAFEWYYKKKNKKNDMVSNLLPHHFML